MDKEEKENINDFIENEDAENKELKKIKECTTDEEIKNNLKMDKKTSNFTNETKRNEKKIKVENNKKDFFSAKEVVILIVVTCVINFLFMTLVGEKIFSDQDATTSKCIDETYLRDENLKSIIEHYQYIKNNFYDINNSVSASDIVNGAIKGMTEALGDQHSAFIPAEDATYDTVLNGEYQGLGVEIAQSLEDGKIYILRIFDGSSAQLAGLQVGDAIISLDGVSTSEMSTTEFGNKVKNGTSTTFTLEILRDEEELTFTINKGNVVIDSVTSQILEKNEQKIGYIGVSVFAANTDLQFHNHLEKLENAGIESLIIDLRGNTGGHLTSVTNMISEFLDRSQVIYQTDKQGQIEKFYSSGRITKKYPIVILANGGSASASEVMIGALKEQLGAKLVGTTTYGKGTAQELIEITETGESYKITTKKWLTPNGNWIDGIGFEPDYVVELNEEYYNNPTMDNDNQLSKAIEVLIEK